jgi:hypothetical protein
MLGSPIASVALVRCCRMSPSPSSPRPKFVTALIETFGLSPWLATAVMLFLIGLGAAAVAWVWFSAPPRTLTLTAGPEGSSFQRYAANYQKALAEEGITLKIESSGGSRDNLTRLQTKDSGVDLAFVQGGLVGRKSPARRRVARQHRLPALVDFLPRHGEDHSALGVCRQALGHRRAGQRCAVLCAGAARRQRHHRVPDDPC